MRVSLSGYTDFPCIWISGVEHLHVLPLVFTWGWRCSEMPPHLVTSTIQIQSWSCPNWGVLYRVLCLHYLCETCRADTTSKCAPQVSVILLIHSLVCHWPPCASGPSLCLLSAKGALKQCVGCRCPCFSSWVAAGVASVRAQHELPHTVPAGCSPPTARHGSVPQPW